MLVRYVRMLSGREHATQVGNKATQKSVARSMENRRWSLPLCKVEWRLEGARVLQIQDTPVKPESHKGKNRKYETYFIFIPSLNLRFGILWYTQLDFV